MQLLNPQTLPVGEIVAMTRVFVVDVDHAVAALAIVLSDMGLALSEAIAGDEALTKARAESPDGSGFNPLPRQALEHRYPQGDR